MDSENQLQVCPRQMCVRQMCPEQVLFSLVGESVARSVSTASTSAAGKSMDSWVDGYHPLDVYPLLLFSRHYVTPIMDYLPQKREGDWLIGIGRIGYSSYLPQMK